MTAREYWTNLAEAIAEGADELADWYGDEAERAYRRLLAAEETCWLLAQGRASRPHLRLVAPQFYDQGEES